MSRICKTCEEDKELTEFSTKGTKKWYNTIPNIL